MTFYSGLADTAARLLKQFGKPATLRVESGGVFNSDTQTNTPSYTNTPVSLLVGNYKGRLSESGTLIQTDDKKLLVSVNGAAEPGIGSLVVDGAVTYVVQSVKSLNPAGTPLLYELQGRK
jgi:ABC-type xylose transport system substrate-binding protein